MDEKKLEKQFKIYAELAKKDKNIDVAGLMAEALSKKDENNLTFGQKRWAYLVSVGVPPFGLIYAVKFWFSDKDDGKDTAMLCIVLTFVAIFVLVLLTNMILSGSSINSGELDQIQNLKPEDIKSLYE